MSSRRTGREYYVTEILPKIGENTYVLLGISAMCYNGLSNANLYVPDLSATIEDIDDVRIKGLVNYFYIKDIDYINYVEPLKEVSNILVPTMERSIIETIKHDLRFADEGYFVEALDYYQMFHYNEPLLIEVANHFGVSMELVNWWLKEADGCTNPEQ